MSLFFSSYIMIYLLLMSPYFSPRAFSSCFCCWYVFCIYRYVLFVHHSSPSVFFLFLLVFLFLAVSSQHFFLDIFVPSSSPSLVLFFFSEFCLFLHICLQLLKSHFVILSCLILYIVSPCYICQPTCFVVHIILLLHISFSFSAILFSF